MRKIEHEGLGLEYEIADHELKQRDVETFFAELRKAGGSAALMAPERNGNVVRAAIGCGFLVGVEDVGDLHPAAVTWLASEIDELVADAFTIPGE